MSSPWKGEAQPLDQARAAAKDVVGAPLPEMDGDHAYDQQRAPIAAAVA